ncbi:uncharacterized protein L3040_001694 [Drepanopeziza brunnea f. sp. 'multigermtubi']|uniref:uncharacterized protein n=1 Tax=Drepanopeziza brunnea f. sp. 'multigermtubi' TaxID=698441 RepID=UPI0023A0B40F|nr:hypothetical protein L3040_001694 [Drepanopeziza brunnea f. sp. 'multigermtubi']
MRVFCGRTLPGPLWATSLVLLNRPPFNERHRIRHGARPQDQFHMAFECLLLPSCLPRRDDQTPRSVQLILARVIVLVLVVLPAAGLRILTQVTSI